MKFGGLKFLEASHIKDVLAVLRFAHNMRDRVAGFRVAQLLPGIGPSSAGRLLDRIAEATDPAWAVSEFKPPAAAIEHWPDFDAMIGTLRHNAAGWPAELDLVVRWYEPHLERKHEDASMRIADLAQLAQIAATYPSRERFLTELTLDHILPRSRGGDNSPVNVVTACVPCNNRKSNRTPGEARMPLLTSQSALRVKLERVVLCHYAEARAEWRKYLFMDVHDDRDVQERVLREQRG